MNRRTSVLAGTLAGVLGGAIVGGSALMGATAQSAPQPGSSPSASSDSARPCGALLKLMPEELKQDLADAWKLPDGAQRREALKKVAGNARDGEYGATVERLAERRLENRGEIWKRLPADLRSDIKELRSLGPRDRRAAVEEILKSAREGDYGEKVKEFAQRRQQRHDECRPGTTS